MTRPLKRIAPRSGFELGGAVHRIALCISLAMVASPFVLGVMTQQNTVGGFQSSKEDIAHATVNKLAHEAYPQWKHEHPARAYLANLGELCEYMNSRDTTDPWGGPYLMQHTPRGILVMSAGADLAFGTADDLRSDTSRRPQ